MYIYIYIYIYVGLYVSACMYYLVSCVLCLCYVMLARPAEKALMLSLYSLVYYIMYICMYVYIYIYIYTHTVRQGFCKRLL